MNKLVKYILIIFAADIILFILFLLPSFIIQGHDSLGPAIAGLLLIGLSLLIQLVAGLIFLNNEKKRDIGQALLLITGIFFLIGFSVCSSN